MTPFKLLSLLLQYPDEELLAHRSSIGRAAAALPPSPQREPILRFLYRWLTDDAGALQRTYVATFDFNKRATLYLSFHAYGDRRQRGVAMLELKRRYAAAGLELTPDELPDYLPAVLEFAALAPEAGLEVLADFRPALELVHAALHVDESPYALLLDALCAALPAISADERERVRRLAAEGPPSELVGLEPFAPPEVMPA